jgi:hypothetical protein
MKRLLMFGALPFLMAGCVPLIPLPISIVTSGLSAASFLATGKSTTDHVISAANDQDCAMHRVAFGDEICQNYGADQYKPETSYSSHFPGDREQDPEAADAPDYWIDENDTNTAEIPEKVEKKLPVNPLLNSSLTNPIRIVPSVSMDLGEVRSIPSDDTGVADVGNWSRSEVPISVDIVELLPPSAGRASTASVIAWDVDLKDEGLRFLSLGSFRSVDRASRLAKRFASLGPRIMTVEVDGRTWRRVAVGPMSKAAVRKLRRSHARIDGRDTWSFIK